MTKYIVRKKFEMDQPDICGKTILWYDEDRWEGDTIVLLLEGVVQAEIPQARRSGTSAPRISRNKRPMNPRERIQRKLELR